ncbi:zinc-dependent protease, TldD/PmbA family [Candidatus Caldarchaeum subterraneum]|uniref:Zinc-dependent protease, TldD/PmbA family n=1 Tax=Caldiarchaeum subterraneum TaxID=311458 RepID=E6N626_CALS0|nr:zinc-dependent protease, TldD/PmbA family [Candidatus Caldarchaeum subterraneum]BAJ50594.1 zinc-dependent protease, TldD/PmbA family [Candidatus Caldarchaeum subterraneum]
MRLDFAVHRRFVRLAQRLGASDVVFTSHQTQWQMIRFSNNKITVSKNGSTVSVDVYVSVKGRRAVQSTTDVSPESVEELVRKTVAAAKSSPETDVYAPLPKGPFKYDKKLLKPVSAEVPPEQLVEYVGEAVNGGLDNGGKRVAGSLVYTRGKMLLTTTGGVEASASSTGIEISVRAFAADDATGHFVSVAADPKQFTPYQAGAKAGEIAKMALNPVDGEAGVYEGLLGPMTFAHILEQVGSWASAFYVDGEMSFLTGLLGQKAGSDVFSLYDDPTLAGTYGATPFDDEGLPTRRNTLFENGVLKTYLHNSTTAKKFNTSSTANAGLIVPHPYNLVCSTGGKSLDKLISSIDNGIWVTNDWYLRYQNYRTGEFSTIPRDGLFLIRKGSVEKPLKGLRLSDNMLNILKGIRDLGNEGYWIKWWEVEIPTYAPHATVEKLNFTRSAL